MAVASGVAIAALTVTAYSAYEQRDAAREQERAAREAAEASRQQYALQRRQADIANLRSVRNAVRQARIARAAIINTGANTGTSGSSGVAGGISSVGAQLTSNLDYFGAMGALGHRINDTQVAQANAAERGGVAAGRSAEWGAIGGLGATVFTGAGGFRTIFS